MAQQRQRIGAVALATETVAEPVRRNVIAQRLLTHTWPDRVLRVTAIDIATGELVVFDRNSGVDLVDAGAYRLQDAAATAKSREAPDRVVPPSPSTVTMSSDFFNPIVGTSKERRIRPVTPT